MEEDGDKGYALMQPLSPSLQRLLQPIARWEPMPKRLALVAGEGHLPVHALNEAIAQGYEVIVFHVGPFWQRSAFTGANAVVGQSAGAIETLLKRFGEFQIESVCFAGKVNKWLLFTHLGLDSLTLDLLKIIPRKNDDAMMRFLIDVFANVGVETLAQVQFMQALFQPETHLTPLLTLKESDWLDACFGFDLALTMGALDVGQTVVVHETMAIALEAIEGTDRCLDRGKGGCVAKVAKPLQDNRFDVPAVGLRTLASMKRSGLNLLVTQANATLFLDDVQHMIKFGHQHGIRLLSCTQQSLEPWRQQLALRQAPPPDAIFHLTGKQEA
jgi:UDP-2,3-diacylglucosamine hydrolase